MEPDLIIIDDEDDYEDVYYRNARVPARRARYASSRSTRAPSRRPRTAIVQQSPHRSSPIVHKYGGLKWGLIADAAAKGLAAIQALPAAPTMGSNAEQNMADLVKYQEALAQHAKRAQQLTTIGSIAKVFLT